MLKDSIGSFITRLCTHFYRDGHKSGPKHPGNKFLFVTERAHQTTECEHNLNSDTHMKKRRQNISCRSSGCQRWSFSKTASTQSVFMLIILWRVGTNSGIHPTNVATDLQNGILIIAVHVNRSQLLKVTERQSEALLDGNPASVYWQCHHVTPSPLLHGFKHNIFISFRCSIIFQRQCH